MYKPFQHSWNSKSTCTPSKKINPWSLIPSVILSPTPSSKKGTSVTIQIRRMDRSTDRCWSWKWRARTCQLWFNWCSVYDWKIRVCWYWKWRVVDPLLILLSLGNGQIGTRFQVASDYNCCLWPRHVLRMGSNCLPGYQRWNNHNFPSNKTKLINC